jgi:hypothetical protein
MNLDEMVRFTTDVSRQVAAAHAQIRYHYVSTMTPMQTKKLGNGGPTIRSRAVITGGH